MSITFNPGALLKQGETLTITTTRPGALSILDGNGKEVLHQPVNAGPVIWQATRPGSYQICLKCEKDILRRYVGVVAPGWSVCQMTVGAFTAEDFASTFHGAGVPVDYYIGMRQATDPRWREYEYVWGDAIHPHVHADGFYEIAPELKHNNPNWESLTHEQIVLRLKKLQEWWQNLGYAPLDRIASYTPCNMLTKACREVGIHVLHSLVPEQNWSDGEWAINHWGMPTCPYWISDEDFRKPGARSADGVIGITMNHYQILLPHLTHWGDFVLSPSHTLRWHRSSESGAEPVRFEQFVRDTLANADPQAQHPLFFVAGFEFGRTFGTGKMTDHNRRGIEKIIELSRTQKLVFAASGDVYAYYMRHIATLPERTLLQRDTWAGARTMGKPGMAGDAIAIEKDGYKALIREGRSLPFFHYDYGQPWRYPTTDINVPDDYAAADEQALVVERSADKVIIVAEQPLARTIPVAIWDAQVDHAQVPISRIAKLDDGRSHHIAELPRGWRGRTEIILTSAKPKSAAPAEWWQTASFGESARRHTYLHFNLPLLRDVEVPVTLKRECLIDGPQGPLGKEGPGLITLKIGPHRTWHRFWNIEAEDIVADEQTKNAVAALRKGNELLSDNWEEELTQHVKQLCQCASQQAGKPVDEAVLEVFCGAKLPLGSRSRAEKHDLVRTKVQGLTAKEHADGVLAYGPGKSFWCHPRSMNFKIHGMSALKIQQPLRLLMHSFDPQALGTQYRVNMGKNTVARWQLPQDPYSPAAWHMLTIDPQHIDAQGRLRVQLACDQTPVLYDWWEEGGFPACLHALWLFA